MYDNEFIDFVEEAFGNANESKSCNKTTDCNNTAFISILELINT